MTIEPGGRLGKARMYYRLGWTAVIFWNAEAFFAEEILTFDGMIDLKLRLNVNTLKWTRAQTVDVCKECGEDIWPAAVILRTRYAQPRQWGILYVMVTLCEDCGKLYEESNETTED